MASRYFAWRLGSRTEALEAPALIATRRVLTVFLPRITRRYSLPASETVTLTLATRRLTFTRRKLMVGATLSPDSKTDGRMVGFDSAAGPVSVLDPPPPPPPPAPVSGCVHGGPGSVGGPGSLSPTVIVPFMPPGARPPWMLQ